LFTGDYEGKIVECAFQVTEEFTENIYSFCNNIHTAEGGTHETGFKTGLTKVINKYAKDLGLLKNKEGSIDGKDIRNGLTAILSIKHHDPQFEGQTKTKLGSSDAKIASEAVTNTWLPMSLDKNIKDIEKIIDHCIKMSNLRKNQNKVKDDFLKNKNSQNAIASKLAVCSQSNNPDKGILTEIFLVEGETSLQKNCPL
jgi:DNA gyrase subunit B